jgi:uncharacterized protein with FMN-binding domain
MGRKRRVLLIAATMIVLIAVAVAVVLSVTFQNKKAMLEATVEKVDLSQIPDGTFHGKCSAFPVIAEVDVTIKDHVITGIDLVKHRNGQGEDAEVIPQMVVDAQSLKVDTISSATYSSKVILFAIRDALQKAAGD